MAAPNVNLAERTLFLGPRIPSHVKLLSKHLSAIKKGTFRELIKLAVLDFEGKNVTPEMYESIRYSEENADNIDAIYGALYAIIRCALSFPEGSLKQEIFRDDLRELKIPGDYIDDLANVTYGSRKSSILANLMSSAPHLTKLKAIRWRVDVAISTSTLNRVLEPTVLMEIELSNGQRETFEIHPAQFHQLRFAVATMLKEIENLEMRNVLKL